MIIRWLGLYNLVWVIDMEKILTSKERESVEKIVRSLDKRSILSQGGPDKAHFGHRRYRTDDEKIWVYYVPDFSDVAKDYIMTGMQKIPSTLGMEDTLHIRMGFMHGKKVMYSKFFGDFVPEAVQNKLISDPGHIVYLLEKNKTQKAQARNAVDEAERMIWRGDYSINAAELFEKTTDFFSMNMDKFYPYDILRDLIIKGMFSYTGLSREQKETEAGLVMNDLFYPSSGINSSIETHLAVLDLVEQEYYSEKPDLEGFIRKVGCYSTNDVVPASLENPDNVMAMMKSYKREYPTIDSIIAYRENWDFQKRMLRMKHNESVRTLVGSFSGDEAVFAENLCRFAEAAAECNEQRRTIITRAYRAYRHLLGHYGLDLMRTPINTVIAHAEAY
ncbi:MAG: hypothetical protein KKE20_06430 [Nanoarchaeota archaeon]|nr:hypothetical protein [Nanoarchaeota archaeon]